jgi:hypothetical protein
LTLGHSPFSAHFGIVFHNRPVFQRGVQGGLQILAEFCVNQAKFIFGGEGGKRRSLSASVLFAMTSARDMISLSLSPSAVGI